MLFFFSLGILSFSKKEEGRFNNFMESSNVVLVVLQNFPMMRKSYLSFYPPKGVCERRSPEGVHFSKLIQERNLTHQFQRLISAFLKSEKCFICGWVGGW